MIRLIANIEAVFRTPFSKLADFALFVSTDLLDIAFPARFRVSAKGVSRPENIYAFSLK